MEGPYYTADTSDKIYRKCTEYIDVSHIAANFTLMALCVTDTSKKYSGLVARTNFVVVVAQ